ncbi:MAG: hypothetical protein FWE42_07390 [Defluviitaleaceae bacterium]|nr:hypothetical protein [Defluviitaleaceae bacterium]
MTKPIVLYDQNRERVGETYPRRAKQLVRSGRAAWLEEGQSLLMNTDYMPYPVAKEDLLTMNEDIYQNNGNIVEASTPVEESNDLLLYLAKQNVAEKKSLFRNIIAYIVAWPMLHFIIGRLYSWGGRGRAFAGDRSIAQVQEAMANVDRSVRIFGSSGASRPYVYLQQEVMNAWGGDGFSLREFLLAIEPTAHYVTTQYFSGITTYNLWWHFFFGVMVAWGVYIALLGIKVLRRHMRNRAPKPDPVALEYQRLMGSV